MAKNSFWGMILVFLIVLSPASLAATIGGTKSTFDISIDRAIVNDAVVIESRTNLVTDIHPILGPNVFVIGTEITALTLLTNTRIEATLKGKDSGLTVSDSTGAFDFYPGQIFAYFTLTLTDGMRDETEFELVIRVADANGKKEEKKYNLATRERRSSSSSGFDISIDLVTANGQPLASSRNNFMTETDFFTMSVEFTALEDAENVHVEAQLRDLRTGNTIADSTSSFDIVDDENYTNFFFIELIDPLSDSGSFELTVKVIDEEGRVEQKIYGIRMDDDIVSGSDFDASIDRVRVNNQLVSSPGTNRIEEEDSFDVLIDITALEDLENAYIEAVMKDKRSGQIVADATSNFNLQEDSSLTALLQLDLIDNMRRSDSFELTVRIVDSEGRRMQKIYSISMDGRSSSNQGALDLSVDRVELEDRMITEGQTNLVLAGANTKELDLKVSITALEDIEKARVQAVLTYENGDVVSDITANFDINDDQSTTKRLEIPLVARTEHDVFRLTLKISDAEGDFVEKFYTLRQTSQNFPVIIDSIEVSPSRVTAGKSAVVGINVQNIGIVRLKGMTVTASIPELGISETRFITKDDLEFTEEFVLQIPQDAEQGQYTIKAEVMQQFGSERQMRQTTFTVLEKAADAKEDLLVITVPITDQDIGKDQTVSYPLIFKNQGPSVGTYTLSVDGRDWANIGLSDSNVFVLAPGESKTVNVLVSSNGKKAGKQSFTVTVSSKTKELRQLILNANLKVVSTPIKTILMWTLITIVILLAILGAIVGARRFTDQEPIEDESHYHAPEPYY